jgi:hypothetical protein
MLGPGGTITVFGSIKKAKECEDGESTIAEAVLFSEEFKEIHATTDPSDMPASKQEVSSAPQSSSLQKTSRRWNLSLAMPPGPPP